MTSLYYVLYHWSVLQAGSRGAGERWVREGEWRHSITYFITDLFCRLAPEVLVSGEYGKENDVIVLHALSLICSAGWLQRCWWAVSREGEWRHGITLSLFCSAGWLQRCWWAVSTGRRTTSSCWARPYGKRSASVNWLAKIHWLHAQASRPVQTLRNSRYDVLSQRLCCAAGCYMVQGTVKLPYNAFSENNSWAQNPNTKRFRRTLIYFNTDTQHANCQGNPLCQATKSHLNNR